MRTKPKATFARIYRLWVGVRSAAEVLPDGLRYWSNGANCEGRKRRFLLPLLVGGCSLATATGFIHKELSIGRRAKGHEVSPVAQGCG